MICNKSVILSTLLSISLFCLSAFSFRILKSTFLNVCLAYVSTPNSPVNVRENIGKLHVYPDKVIAAPEFRINFSFYDCLFFCTESCNLSISAWKHRCDCKLKIWLNDEKNLKKMFFLLNLATLYLRCTRKSHRPYHCECTAKRGSLTVLKTSFPL